MCGGVLELDAVRDVHGGIDPEHPGLWRYAAWLPFRADPISLGEITTPVVRVAWSDITLECKHDGLLPTGSFKDRGSAVMIAWAASQGISHVVTDSSGNAGASVAAYAARAGIACGVYVPATSSATKLVQTEVHGAHVFRVHGPRAAAEEAAIGASTNSGAVYVPHAFNPFFVEGTRTFAYEVFEQYGDALPDAIVMPVGAGTLFLGIHRGFENLREAGLVSAVPRLYGVQAAACAPLAEAATAGREEPMTVSPTPSLAEGIAIAAPARGRSVLTAAASTGGTVISVEEPAICEALRRLGAMGVFVEPTTAAALAAIQPLRRSGSLGREERIMVALTGTGLKAAATVADCLADDRFPSGPPTVVRS